MREINITMSQEEMDWSAVTQRRTVMLLQSDWTQLPDTGLTVESVFAWREWRHQVRNVNKDTHGDTLSASVRLQALADQMPESDFSGDKYTFFEQNASKSVYTRQEFRHMIQDILDEMGLIEAPEEPVEAHPLDNVANLESGKIVATSCLQEAYRAKVAKVSPDGETFLMYTERLNQAVDCLSGTGSNFPLLRVLNKDENVSETLIAKSVLMGHGNMMQRFVKIEEAYLQSLQEIKDSDTIDGLRKVLDTFNGHRY